MKEYIIIAAMLTAFILGITGELTETLVSIVNQSFGGEIRPEFDAKFIKVKQ